MPQYSFKPFPKPDVIPEEELQKINYILNNCWNNLNPSSTPSGKKINIF